MWTRRRISLLIVVVVGVALAVYFEPSHCVRGWLWGEAFYDGRPTSYWGAELEHWHVDYGEGGGGGFSENYARRSMVPPWIERLLPKREAEWPGLLDGDPEAIFVLQALRSHPFGHVSWLAQVGIDRIHTGERGPWHYWSLPDQ